MSSGPVEHTSLPTSNRLSMLLVASTWAPWLADDVPDLSLENMVPVADGADGRLLPRRKSDQPILSDVPSRRARCSTRTAARRPVAGENDDDGRLEMQQVRGDHCVTSPTPILTRGMLKQESKCTRCYYLVQRRFRFVRKAQVEIVMYVCDPVMASPIRCPSLKARARLVRLRRQIRHNA